MEKDTELDKTIQTPTEDNQTPPEPISSELEGVEGDTKPDNTEEKQSKPWLFKKGESGNPNGRPKGSKNWDTYYWEAIKKIAQANGKTAEEFDIELGSKFIELARKGDLRALKDLFDRRFGKPKESHEITGKDGGPIEITKVEWVIDRGDGDESRLIEDES